MSPTPAVRQQRFDLPNLAEARPLLNWSDDAILCRSARPASGGLRVMFTALGRPLNALCDSVYDPRTDRMFTFHAPAVFAYEAERLVLAGPNSRPLSFTIAERFIRDVRGVRHYAAPLDKRRFPRPPSGWCSWYFYYQGYEGHEFNEQEVLRNAEWMATHMKPFGAEYVQIDDGWQASGRGLGENRDWETIDRRFPHGMRWLADRIHALGLKAGIWIAPHGQSNTDFVLANRDAFLWRENGASAGEDPDNPADVKKFNWEGRYVVDTSGPAGQAYMRRLFTRLAREWDYDYFKIDGQPLVQDLYAGNAARFAQPSIPPDEAYRAGLRIIRETIGEQRFLLGCWGTPWWAAGIVNGCRTGADVDARVGWTGLRPALQCTWDHYWSHNLVWYADPDCVCVREPLTLEQARVWATLMALTGQVLMASDKMYELPEERVDLLRRIFPAADIRPMELYPVEQPDVICLKIDDAAGRRDIVGMFNWTDETRTLTIRPEDLGLASRKGIGGRLDHVVYDVWRKELIGRLTDELSVELAPTSCRVLCIRPIRPDAPTLLGTSRHLTQGAPDLEDYRVEDGIIRGTSRVVAGDPYEIRFFLEPADIAFELCEPKSDAIDVLFSLVQCGPIATLTLSSNHGGVIEWTIRATQHPLPTPTASVHPRGRAGESAAATRPPA